MVGCARPVAQVEKTCELDLTQDIPVKEEKNMVLVGKKAPMFKAPAFYNGEFSDINLEDYKGQWVMLCFYPGDFTFV